MSEDEGYSHPVVRVLTPLKNEGGGQERTVVGASSHEKGERKSSHAQRLGVSNLVSAGTRRVVPDVGAAVVVVLLALWVVPG